mgnify:FL=1
MNIGEKIRKAREFKDVSQQYLADQLNISQKQLSRIENDHVSPTFETLEKICESLDIKLHELLQLNESMVFNSYTQHQRGGEFAAYNNTDVKQIEALYKQLIDLSIS